MPDAAADRRAGSERWLEPFLARLAYPARRAVCPLSLAGLIGRGEREELGLDHFEGRSWTGRHRHALMTLIAFAFLQHRRLTAAGRGEKGRTAPVAEPAGDQAGPVERFVPPRPPPLRCPHCRCRLASRSPPDLPK